MTPTTEDQPHPDLNSLRVANGTPILVFGTRTVTVSLDLRGEFMWSFIVADNPCV